MQDSETLIEASFIAALKSAGRDIVIQCPTQLATWISTGERLAAIKGALLTSSADKIQLVLDDPNPDTAPIIGLINLSRRLSSKFLVRCVTVDAPKFKQLTLLNHRSLWVGHFIDNESVPSVHSTELLSLQQSQIAQDNFARLWDHQTWDNPDIREIYL